MHLGLICAIAASVVVAAEDGSDAWLRYARLPDAHQQHHNLPDVISVLNRSEASPVFTAGQELQMAFHGIYGYSSHIYHYDEELSAFPNGSVVVVGTVEQYTQAYGEINVEHLEGDGFWLDTTCNFVKILAITERGALYGTFEYITMLAQGNLSRRQCANNPAVPLRWANQWDNMDGSIERGYAGKSIFFEDGTIVKNLTRAGQFARLMASIRVNTIVVNNVNADSKTLSRENLDGLARIADVFRPYGVQLAISLYFSSPTRSVPGRPNLDTFDPLDQGVISWWQDVADDIYQRIPDMAGYLVKANSEGQPGPIDYGRTLSEGANLFAKSIQKYGGVVMFRAFVYGPVDESDWKADRATAAVDAFRPLDGQFNDNVVVQIKYGPLDFQVREPVSPLFANLRKENLAIEFQVSPEYLGQDCHLLYLPPLWRTILDFDLQIDGKHTPTTDVYTGKVFNNTLNGFVGVTNVGLNKTWLGSHLAMSNLYAFGRLAWDPTLRSEDILNDWTRLTFGTDQRVVDTLTDISLASWRAYESYSGNLGLITLTEASHFGPNPQRADDGNTNGLFTRADRNGIGIDRTAYNGSGYAAQYPSEVAEAFESITTTPEDLLLWFHHVPYSHLLSSGKTILQHMYDAHYDGAKAAHGFLSKWQDLKGLIDEERYTAQLFKQDFQAGHAIVWRDSIVNWLHTVTHIADEAGRVGVHPYRIEAESMKLDGYRIIDVVPYNAASNATAISVKSGRSSGTAMVTLNFTTGIYDIAVNYFDLFGGNSIYTLSINNKEVGRWTSDQRPWRGSTQGPAVLGRVPSYTITSGAAMRNTFKGIQVRHGDRLKIVGISDGSEPAPLDYISILPSGTVD